MLSGVALALIVLYGGYQAIDGHITVGTVVAFVATLSFLFEPIQQLSQLYTTYQSGMAALEKIFQLLDTKPTLEDRPNAPALGPIRGEVRFEDVTFAYARGRRAADNGPRRPRRCSLERRPGRAAGPDGRARGRHRRGQVDDGQARRALLRPHARARARRRARPSRGLRPSLRSQMGIVPQEAFLFSGPCARTSPSGARTRRTSRSAQPRRRSAPTSSSPSCRAATTPRSASAARSCPPASAS